MRKREEYTEMMFRVSPRIRKRSKYTSVSSVCSVCVNAELYVYILNIQQLLGCTVDNSNDIISS